MNSNGERTIQDQETTRNQITTAIEEAYENRCEYRLELKRLEKKIRRFINKWSPKPSRIRYQDREEYQNITREIEVERENWYRELNTIELLREEAILEGFEECGKKKGGGSDGLIHNKELSSNSQQTTPGHK